LLLLLLLLLLLCLPLPKLPSPISAERSYCRRSLSRNDPCLLIFPDGVSALYIPSSVSHRSW
jgi:hypothetical protein